MKQKNFARMYRKKSERWTKLKNASNISNHKSKIRKKPLTGKPRNIWGSCIKIQWEDCKADINKYNHTVLDACVLSKTVEAKTNTGEPRMNCYCIDIIKRPEAMFRAQLTWFKTKS